MTDALQGAIKLVHRGVWVSLFCLACVAGVLALYAVAAVIGTVWTVDGRNAVPHNGTRTVYILSNGFHSDIAIPVSNSRAPEGLPELSSDLPGGLADVRYLIIGWGSQTAYTRLLALSDLTPEIIVKALLFDKSVVRVLPVFRIPHGRGVYRLNLDDRQFDRLLAFIAGTFARSAEGDTQLLDGISHGFGDVFYRAQRRFSPFYGCNAWTGHALREAGVSFGRWTPFAQSIEWNLERLQPAL
ncbi:MAG: DUF2459 domain-containing protein [Pseudomonadota bacterium]